MAVTSSFEGRTLAPDVGDLELTVGWGRRGARGVTMPGPGRLTERERTSEELAELEEGAMALGLTREEAMARLGGSTLDVHLNGKAFWRNVPPAVFDYVLGGYPVVKKWLSYREGIILGRPLTAEEAREFTAIARRLTALLLLETPLDENYEAVKGSCYPWTENRE